MKVCIACGFCYPSSNMYNFERVLNRLSWLCLFFFSRVLLLGGRDRREGGWMSKGEERRVLWTGERSLGGQERGISPFPLTSISSPFYQSLISQTLTPDSSLHFILRQMESFSTTWRWGRLWSINNNGSYSPSMRLHKCVPENKSWSGVNGIISKDI